MKILHTSDWHLGKKLEGLKRIEEQKKFIEILENIIVGEKPDLLLIAGDIFDSPNPSAEAETLFFNTLKKLTFKKNMGIVVIPGNHDNPERLASINSLAKEFGIIIYEKPFEKKEIGKYGEIEILESYEGGAILNINKEKIFLYSLPYPSSATLNENLEEEFYSSRICQIIKEGISYNKKNIPTVIMSHIFVSNNKENELGGVMSVNEEELPDVDYIALGHIHKPMIFKNKKMAYSGSPIEYRLSESKFSKKVLIVKVEGNLRTEIKEIELENYKPIKTYEVHSNEEAVELSEKLKDKNEWIYLKIFTKFHLKSSNIKKIKENKNIVEIIPIIENEEDDYEEVIDYSDIDIKESFIDFYKVTSGTKPENEVFNLFVKLVEDDK